MPYVRAMIRALYVCVAMMLAVRVTATEPLELRATVPPLPPFGRATDDFRSRDFYADPEILLHDGVYYLFATSNDSHNSYYDPGMGLGFRCFSSTDLHTWRDRGLAFNARDAKAAPHSRDMLWAPQPFCGPDGGFYLAFNAVGEGWKMFEPMSHLQRICLARAQRPDGPYREWRAPLVDTKQIPGYVDGEHGVIGMIDAYVLQDNSTAPSTSYLFWSGINDEKNENLLWGAQLKPDLSGLLLPPDGPEPRILIGPDGNQDWETHACAGRLIYEAPSVLRQGDTYYLLYSANSFNTPEYGMGYATARHPLGPYTRSCGNPILSTDTGSSSSTALLGPGAGSFFRDAAGKPHIVCHSITRSTTEPMCSNGAGHARHVRILDMEFTDDSTLLLHK